MRRIAVIMACHNRCAQTLACLRALGAAELELRVRDRKIDVFLVDDGSTDGTEEAVKNEFSHVHIIKGDGSLFWAKGMRLAWDEAEKCGAYDFYLWLNDDVVLKQGAIDAALRDWKSLGRDDVVIVGACEYKGVCTYGATDAFDHKLVPNGTPQRAEGWLNGNFVLVPRCVAERVGKISNRFSHARADYEYAERLRRARIPFYLSSRYVGTCANDFREKMRGKGVRARLAMLFRPGYWNLHDLWILKREYYGVARAVVSCAHLAMIALRGDDC